MIVNRANLFARQGMSRREALRLSSAFAALVVQGGAVRSALAEEANAQVIRARIPVRPAPIEISLSSTGVIVVDMQNNFVSKSGLLDRIGANISMIQRAVRPTSEVIAAGRKLGMKIIYLKMAFKTDLSDVGPEGLPNWIAHQSAGVGKTMTAPDGRIGRILIRDTWNTEVVAELKPQTQDLQIYKHRYSGFFDTDLDAKLKRHGVRNLLVTGCTTSV
jgi:ureidoacrylate peracid hydrolase